MSNPSSDIVSILDRSPIVPVLTVPALNDAIPMASALAEGGLVVLEITLRTPAALGAIENISRQFPNIIVGAGTVLRKEQIDQCHNAGAHFIVTPGLSPQLVHHAEHRSIPILPGVSTASEIMAGIAEGLQCFKISLSCEYAIT